MGAVQATAARALPDTRAGAAGAVGAPAITAADGDQTPSPRELAARTCTSYSPALERPVSVCDRPEEATSSAHTVGVRMSVTPEAVVVTQK